MKPEEIEIGATVIYWGEWHSKENKHNPKQVIIESLPRQLETGDWLCRVSGIYGGVDVRHLERGEVAQTETSSVLKKPEDAWILARERQPPVNKRGISVQVLMYEEARFKVGHYSKNAYHPNGRWFCPGEELSCHPTHWKYITPPKS